MNIKCAVTSLIVGLGLVSAAQATPSTPKGEISVSQVMEMIQRSPKDNAARNAAMAYLAAVGETTGLLVAEGGKRAPGIIKCSKPLGISSKEALAALSATDRANRSKTAATPILVDDMLARAGCR